MILFIDTHGDTTGLERSIAELGLRPHVVRDIMEVASKDDCPQIDSVIVDSVAVVSVL